MTKKSNLKKSAPMATDKPFKPTNERHSVETRKIKNGYIMRRSGPGIGKDEYDSEETYHPKKPKVQIQLGSSNPKAASGGAAKPAIAARNKRLSKVAL